MDLFLGCKHEETTQTSPWTGKKIRVLTYNMESFLEDAVARYMTLSGCGILRKVATPFLEDYDPNAPTVNSQSAGAGVNGSAGKAVDNVGDGELKHCEASLLL